jgi:hypothetical protein
MATNASKNRAKIKRLEAKIEALKKQYPDVKFYDTDFMYAFNSIHKLTKQKIYTECDLSACTDDTKKFSCRECICWKQHAFPR